MTPQQIQAEELRCIELGKKMIIDTFEEGEDTAVLLAALTYACAMILDDTGVSPKVFAERVEATLYGVQRARKSVRR